MSWTLDYADGSANAYHFHAEGDGARFEYVPVTPERSSTGMYSGGPPRAGVLDAAATATLWRHVRELEAATTLHVEERGKGTGLFHVDEGSGERRFVVRRGPELLRFDELLATYH